MPAMVVYAWRTMTLHGLEQSDPPLCPHEPMVSTRPQNETDVEMAPVVQVSPNTSKSRKGRGRKVSEIQSSPIQSLDRSQAYKTQLVIKLNSEYDDSTGPQTRQTRHRAKGRKVSKKQYTTL
jgi:hypothetical protein